MNPSQLGSFESIPLAAIRPSPTNPRKNFDPIALAELTRSIGKRPSGERPDYQAVTRAVPKLVKVVFDAALPELHEVALLLLAADATDVNSYADKTRDREKMWALAKQAGIDADSHFATCTRRADFRKAS